MFCKYCGKQIEKDFIYCSYCGKQQSLNEKIESSTRSKIQNEDIIVQNSYLQNKKSRKQFTYYFILGIGIIVALCCYFVLNDNKMADITIDKVSKELTESTKKYDELFEFHGGLARVKKEKKFGFIDKLGKEIIPCKYDDAEDFEFGVAVVELNGKRGLINHVGKTIVPCIYDGISFFDKDSTATAYLNDKWGRIDITGKVVISFEYEYCDDFSEGMAAVKKNGLFGFVNKDDKLIIPCQYKELYDGMGFSEGLVGVRNCDGEWGYINKIGNIVIPFNEDLTGAPFSSGLTTIKRGGIKYYFYQGGIRKKETPFEMAVIDKKGNLVSEYAEVQSIHTFRDGYSVVRDNEYRYGLINDYCEFIIPCKYSFIANGFDKKYVVIASGGKYGMANKHTGEVVIPIDYEIDISGWKFQEGVIPVKKDGKYGYINESNQIIIPLRYDDAYSFSEGFAVVKRYGKYGYVDRYGQDTFN